MHFLLFYEVGEDYVARRAEFRDAHLKKAWAASARGELLLGGAYANPTDGAVLLFQGDSPEVAEKFARADPYVTSGVIKRWHVREWTTVVGENAAAPVRPRAASADGKLPAAKSQTVVESQGMILRVWRAHATAEKAPDYARHAAGKVFPALARIAGHRGAYLVRRALGTSVELMVLTLWDSMEAVRRFAGAKPEKAVVEPEAQAVLTDFDESVTHYEVVHHP